MQRIYSSKIDHFTNLHIAIEFNRLRKIGFLKESQGHIDNIEYIAAEVSKIILDYIESVEMTYSPILNLSNLVIHKSDIHVDNLFFDEIRLTDSFYFFNDTTVAAGSYYSEKSGNIDDNKYIVTLGIQFSSSKKYMAESLPPLIAHELAHAYEDWNLNKTVLIKDKQEKLLNKSKQEIYKLLQSNNPYIESFAEVTYFSFDDEITAMKNEICDEIFLNRCNLKDVTNATQILINTEVYKRILSMQRKIEFLKSASICQKPELIAIYNNIYETSITSFNTFLKNIESGFISAKNKIIKAASKYICSMYLIKDSRGLARR